MLLLTFKLHPINTLLVTMLIVFFSIDLLAGEVTISKSKNLINNQIFEEKEARAREYKQLEAKRKYENEQWIYTLPATCLLYQNQYLIYQCGKGSFYKGYDVDNGIKYKKLRDPDILGL